VRQRHGNILINIKKKKTKRINKDIKMDKWRDYFIELLGGT